VLSRATQGEPIFSEDNDKDLFIARLGAHSRAWDGKIYAYVIMPNHFHLLLQVSKQPLQALLQPLLAWYAQRYNERRERQGHVFQGRYQSIVVEREGHLLELIRYLHLNPVRGGLAATPEDYPWSSRAAYCGRARSGWLAANEALALFSQDRRRALQEYREFLEDGMSLGRMPDWYRRPRLRRAITQAGSLPPSVRGLTALAEAIGLSPKIVFRESIGGLPQQTALLVFVAVERGGLSAAEVGAVLGCHRSTVYRYFQQAQSLQQRSPAFRRHIGHALRACQ